MTLEALRYAWRADPESEYDSANRPPLEMEELVELVRTAPSKLRNGLGPD